MYCRAVSSPSTFYISSNLPLVLDPASDFSHLAVSRSTHLLHLLRAPLPLILPPPLHVLLQLAALFLMLLEVLLLLSFLLGQQLSRNIADLRKMLG